MKQETGVDMKQKTAKQLGLPEGFRFRKDNKQKIIAAAVVLKFKAEAEKIANRDIQYMQCIAEYLYPKDLLSTHLHNAQLFCKTPKDQVINYTKTMDIKFPPIKGIREVNLGCTHEGGYSGNGRDGVASLDVGYVGEGVLSGYVNKTLLPDKKTELSTEKIVSYPYLVGNTAFSPDQIGEVLPKEYLRKLADFKLKTVEFKKRVLKYREGIEIVIGSYTSLVKLCNTHKEFISWARIAHLGPEGERCSDIPIADLMQDLKKM